MTQNSVAGRVVWIDVLRIVACFMVVMSHSCDFFVQQFDDNPSEFLAGSVWGSMMRACVPLFVMISGILLLPVRQPTGLFYRRKLSRIIWPLAVWSLVTPLLYLAYNPALDPGVYDSGKTFYYMVTWPLNFNYATTPLWYLYMLVGLYLVMPIISPWLIQADRKEIRRFLYVWGFTLFLPAIQLIAPMLGYEGNYGNTGVFGVCDWNIYGSFYYFAGFIGYIVLAYYMKTYPTNWSMSKTISRAVPLFLLGYAITFGGFVWIQSQFPGDYAFLELPWYFTGFSVFLMTCAVFMVIQKVKIRSEKTACRLSRWASLTFGIYLCHFLIVQMVYDLVYANVPVPAWVQMPVIAVVTFCVSAGVVRLLQLLPGHKYIIG